ncbi:MAG: hypothetical protein ACLU8S_01585 [Coprococcus phoceensis]
MQGFTCKRKEMTKEYGENVRGIYIDSTFYLINGNQIESYNLENYEKNRRTYTLKTDIFRFYILNFKNNNKI